MLMIRLYLHSVPLVQYGFYLCVLEERKILEIPIILLKLSFSQMLLLSGSSYFCDNI